MERHSETLGNALQLFYGDVLAVRPIGYFAVLQDAEQISVHARGPGTEWVREPFPSDPVF